MATSTEKITASEERRRKQNNLVLQEKLRFDPTLGARMPEDVIYKIIQMAGAGNWRYPGKGLDWRKNATGKWRKQWSDDFEKGAGVRKPKFIFRIKKDERIRMLTEHFHYIGKNHRSHTLRTLANNRPLVIDVRHNIPCVVRGLCDRNVCGQTKGQFYFICNQPGYFGAKLHHVSVDTWVRKTTKSSNMY
jgi:hypothetical protein